MNLILFVQFKQIDACNTLKESWDRDMFITGNIIFSVNDPL